MKKIRYILILFFIITCGITLYCKDKEIDDILALLFTIVYLYVSFVTGGWYITWILWLVYSLVIKIVHLVLDAKEEKK